MTTWIGANGLRGFDSKGKPILYPELPRFYGLTQRITSETPKVRSSEMAVWDPLVGRR